MVWITGCAPHAAFSLQNLAQKILPPAAQSVLMRDSTLELKVRCMCQTSVCCHGVQLTCTGGCAGQKWTTRQRLIQEGHRNPVKQLQDGLWQVLEDQPA